MEFSPASSTYSSGQPSPPETVTLHTTSRTSPSTDCPVTAGPDYSATLHPTQPALEPLTHGQSRSLPASATECSGQSDTFPLKLLAVPFIKFHQNLIYCCVPARRGLQRTARAATRHVDRDPLVRPQVDQTYISKLGNHLDKNFKKHESHT